MYNNHHITTMSYCLYKQYWLSAGLGSLNWPTSSVPTHNLWALIPYLHQWVQKQTSPNQLESMYNAMYIVQFTFHMQNPYQSIYTELSCYSNNIVKLNTME